MGVNMQTWSHNTDKTTGTGYLKVVTTTAEGGVPVSSTVTISYNNDVIHSLHTNHTGTTETIPLNAPPIDMALDANYKQAPYSTYNIRAEAYGFTTVNIHGVQIFDTITSILPINMHPISDSKAAQYNPSKNAEITHNIPPHQLLNTYPSFEEKPEINANNTAHIDNLKKAANKAVYPNWPAAAIEANIYCIASQMLNRTKTKGHAKGQGFGNPALWDNNSDKYSQTFQNIDEMVEKIYKRYLKLANSSEPFFAQYSDGRYATGTGLWQWGSVALAERDLDALEILRHYFPEDIEIVEAENFAGMHGHANQSTCNASRHATDSLSPKQQPIGHVPTSQLLAMFLISQLAKPETI